MIDTTKPLTEADPADLRAYLDNLHSRRESYRLAKRIVEEGSCALAIAEATRALAIINRRATEAEDQRSAEGRALTADEVRAVLDERKLYIVKPIQPTMNDIALEVYGHGRACDAAALQGDDLQAVLSEIADRVAEKLAGRVVASSDAAWRTVADRLADALVGAADSPDMALDEYRKLAAEYARSKAGYLPVTAGSRNEEFVAMRAALQKRLEEHGDLHPVVVAAEAWRDSASNGLGSHAEVDLQSAVDFYRSKRSKAGG